MLKKLLPFLEKLKPKIKSPQPVQNRVAAPSLNPVPNPSPNLLNPEILKDSEKAVLHDSLYAFIIIIIQVVFVIVLSVNYFLDQRVESLKTDINDLTIKINSYNDVKKAISGVSLKLEKYMAINSQRIFLQKKVAFLFSGAFGVITLQDMSISKSSSIIIAKADSPLSFSTLLSNYFKDKSVQAVILQSANLNANDGTFSMVFEVVFK